jgi:hypothetical protein
MTNVGAERTLRYSLRGTDGRFCCAVAFKTLLKNDGDWSIEDYKRFY